MGTVLASGDLPGLTRVLAAGYHGPPELTLTRAFTEWTFDPWMTALVVILGGSYLAGLCRVAGWPVARRIWFLGLGLGFLVIATMSWVGAYQPVLMYARAVQTVLLVLVVPLFLALGRPISLFTAVFPAAGRRLGSAIGSRPARLVTFPAITTFALVAVPFVMYFTSWYTAVFRSGTVRELTYLALMVPGFVFFWTLLRVDPVPKKYSYAVSMWITGAEVIGDAFLGIAVIANQNLIGAAYYHALARPWGPTLATDEVIAGGVLWVLGDLVGLPFLAAQLIQMMREDESDAARIDADLDAKDAELEAAAAAQEPDAEPRPWWEDDPRFTGRFKANLGQRLRPGVSACGRESQPAADVQRPALRQFLAGYELLRLHRAPGRYVGVGRRVVGQDGHYGPERHVPDLLGEHDDGDRALTAQRVDRQRRGGR
jgi:cytochrome c oxidase assembly factor CtaG